MCDTTAAEASDLIEVDLGPRARGYFTTRGPSRRRVVPPRTGMPRARKGPHMTGGTWRSTSGTTRNVFIVIVVGSRSCSGSSRGATWPG